MEHTNDERYYFLTEVIGIDEMAMNILIAINGDTKETYNDALFYYVGERDIDAAIDEYNADPEE